MQVAREHKITDHFYSIRRPDGEKKIHYLSNFKLEMLGYAYLAKQPQITHSFIPLGSRSKKHGRGETLILQNLLKVFRFLNKGTVN